MGAKRERLRKAAEEEFLSLNEMQLLIEQRIAAGEESNADGNGVANIFGNDVVRGDTMSSGVIVGGRSSEKDELVKFLREIEEWEMAVSLEGARVQRKRRQRKTKPGEWESLFARPKLSPRSRSMHLHFCGLSFSSFI